MKYSFLHLEIFQVDFTEDQIEDIKDGFELYDRTGEGKLFFNQVNFRCKILERKYLMSANNSIGKRNLQLIFGQRNVLNEKHYFKP